MLYVWCEWCACARVCERVVSVITSPLARSCADVSGLCARVHPCVWNGDWAQAHSDVWLQIWRQNCLNESGAKCMKNGTCRKVPVNDVRHTTNFALASVHSSSQIDKTVFFFTAPNMSKRAHGTAFPDTMVQRADELIDACEAGNAADVARLLATGDVAVQHKGHQALVRVCARGHVAILDQLLAYVDEHWCRAFIPTHDTLVAAAGGGHVAVVQKVLQEHFLDRGVAVNDALLRAVNRQQEATACILIADADFDVAYRRCQALKIAAYSLYGAHHLYAPADPLAPRRHIRMLDALLQRACQGRGLSAFRLAVQLLWFVPALDELHTLCCERNPCVPGDAALHDARGTGKDALAQFLQSCYFASPA